jgi:hypothetical protein
MKRNIPTTTHTVLLRFFSRAFCSGDIHFMWLAADDVRWRLLPTLALRFEEVLLRRDELNECI